MMNDEKLHSCTLSWWGVCWVTSYPRTVYYLFYVIYALLISKSAAAAPQPEEQPAAPPSHLLSVQFMFIMYLILWFSHVILSL